MQIKSFRKIVKLEIILGKTLYAIQSKTQNPWDKNNSTILKAHTLNTLRILMTLTSRRTLPTRPTTRVSFIPSDSRIKGGHYNAGLA